MSPPNGWRNVALGILASAVLTGSAGWFMWGQDKPARAEVSQMIQRESPYVEDRRSMNELAVTVHALTEAVDALKLTVAELSARLGE